MARVLEDFAAKYDLVLAQDKNDLLERLGGRSRYIPGQNGSVIESRAPGRLLVSVVHLSGWERTKLEFRFAYHHIRVLPDRSSNRTLSAEFCADNERQARLVIELARLKNMNTCSSNTTPPYDDKILSQRRIPSANLIAASVLRKFARALRELAR